MAKKIIFIDPGHGGKDPGATNGRRHEADDNLRLSLLIKELLEKQDVETILSRSTDKHLELSERTRMANKAKADYFLSIHRNSFSKASTGNEIWVYSKATTETQAKAKKIVDAICAVDGLTNRGMKMGAASYNDYAVNRDTSMASALLEISFISNDIDNSRYDKCINEYAKVIAKALCENVGVDFHESALKGDVDGDGRLTPSDARAALRGAVGIKNLSEEQKKAADIDGDGKVTPSDARNILKKSVGIYDE